MPESPRNEQSSPTLPNVASGGGSGYPALVAPVVTEGVIQREASGTTTAAVNVGASSGGAGGPYTYSAVSLDAPGGSSAAVSGTVPGALSVTGLGDDEAVVLSGTVTDPTTSQVVSWQHTVDVAASGGGGGGASWVDIEDVDATTVANSGPHTSGVQTFSFTDYASVSVTASRVSPNTGNIEAVNGTGIVVTGIGNGSMRAGVLLTDILTAYDREYALGGAIAVHVVYEVVWGAATGNGPIIGLNNIVSHNSGKLRGYRGSYDNSDGSEDQQVRSNTSNPTFNTLTTAATAGVVTTILHAGEIVELMWTAGSTPPTPAPGASGTEMVGGGSVGVQASTIGYDPLYSVITATLACTITVKRILIQRYQ